jgi:hypothetical protein
MCVDVFTCNDCSKSFLIRELLTITIYISKEGTVVVARISLKFIYLTTLVKVVISNFQKIFQLFSTCEV